MMTDLLQSTCQPGLLVDAPNGDPDFRAAFTSSQGTLEILRSASPVSLNVKPAKMNISLRGI